jgi:hypothetical protein
MNDQLIELRGLISGLILAEHHGDRRPSALYQAGILELFDVLTAERDSAKALLASVKAKREAVLPGGAP